MRIFVAVLVPLLLFPGTIWSQEETSEEASTVTIPPEDLPALRQLLDDPAVGTAVLLALLGRSGDGVQLLEGLELQPVVITREEGSSVVGLEYSLKHEMLNVDLSTASGVNTRGLSYTFDGRGLLTPDEADNPQNFLEAALSFHFFDSTGGVSKKIGGAVFNEISAALAGIEDEEELDTEWRKVQDDLLATLSTQRVIDVSLHVALEADQAIDAQQLTYGAQISFDLKPWNPKSPPAQLNLFDHPFALIRVLTGYDDRYQPRGSSFPTFLVALDRVSPSADHPRVAVGDDDDFNRARGEVSFRTPLAASGETRYFFDLNYRYYFELDASRAVRAAGLDDYEYLSLAITSSQGVFASYAKGSLPFEVQSEAVYQIGFKFNVE